MKSKSSLALSMVISLATAQAAICADAPKKPVAKTDKPVAAAKSTPPAKGSKDAPKDAKDAAPKATAKDAAPGKDAAPAADNIKDPVAVVEGTEIKKAELDEALMGIMAQRGGTLADIPPEQKAGAYRMILDDLIIDRLVTKRSEKITITDAEVDETFKKVTASGGTEEEVKKQIEKSGQTVAKIKESIRTNLRQQRWVEDQIKGKDDVTDAELDEFYKKNPEQFQSPERVRASHVLIALKPDATPETVTEKEKLAKSISERAKKGEDFAKLAKELSEDPSAKQNSGDLDFFAKEQMVPEFANAAFAMKKDEISEPVRSQFGYHIIKLTDRKPAETITLETAKPKLLPFLKNQKKQSAVEALVKDIRAKADVKINLPELPVPSAPAAPAPGDAAIEPVPEAPVTK